MFPSTVILGRKGNGPWVGLPDGLSWKLKKLGWEVMTAQQLIEHEAKSKTSRRLIGKSTPPKTKA